MKARKKLQLFNISSSSKTFQTLFWCFFLYRLIWPFVVCRFAPLKNSSLYSSDFSANIALFPPFLRLTSVFRRMNSVLRAKADVLKAQPKNMMTLKMKASVWENSKATSSFSSQKKSSKRSFPFAIWIWVYLIPIRVFTSLMCTYP